MRTMASKPNVGMPVAEARHSPYTVSVLAKAEDDFPIIPLHKVEFKFTNLQIVIRSKLVLRSH